MDPTQRGWNRRSVWGAALATLAVVAALSWYLAPSRVQLSPDTYDIAVALYRVCNQQDRAGLEQIQDKLHDLGDATDANDPSISHLRSIVAEARTGQWSLAMRRAHKALQDQVPGS